MSNLDEALERFQRVDLEYAGGLANHGPMGAEALESLGHQAKIPAFVDIYAPRLPPLAEGRPIPPAERAAARGEIVRRADWVATYLAALDEGTEAAAAGAAPGQWREVVAREVPPLLPGLFAGAGHGLLRVAHAIRALEREEGVFRRRELAHGLAYWAARYQTLPGLPGAGVTPGRELEAALDDWPLVGETDARLGFFFRVVERLDDWPPFAVAVEDLRLPSPEGIGSFLGVLCRRAAGLYLAHPGARIAYVHALTIPSAIRFLLPYLKSEDAVAAAGFALRAVGALHAIFGDPASCADEDEEVLRVAGDWVEIRYHAACSIQEHSIKMAEACWREDRLAPDPVFRRAAADAALQIGVRSEASVC